MIPSLKTDTSSSNIASSQDLDTMKRWPFPSDTLFALSSVNLGAVRAHRDRPNERATYNGNKNSEGVGKPLPA